jgi:hypothetical protein
MIRNMIAACRGRTIIDTVGPDIYLKYSFLNLAIGCEYF